MLKITECDRNLVSVAVYGSSLKCLDTSGEAKALGLPPGLTQIFRNQPACRLFQGIQDGWDWVPESTVPNSVFPGAKLRVNIEPMLVCPDLGFYLKRRFWHA